MKDKISFPFKKKVYMGDEYIKKVLKENKLMQENQKLKDMNKQLMKEIQWEDKVLKTIGILGLILELESYKGNIEIDLVKLLKFLKEVKE